MSLTIEGTTRNGRPITRECPVCGEDMVKTEGGVWQCQNDDCAHQEVR